MNGSTNTVTRIPRKSPNWVGGLGVTKKGQRDGGVEIVALWE